MYVVIIRPVHEEDGYTEIFGPFEGFNEAYHAGETLVAGASYVVGDIEYRKLRKER